MAKDCGLLTCSELFELASTPTTLELLFCREPSETDSGKLSPSHISMLVDESPLVNFMQRVQSAPLPGADAFIVCYEASGVHKAAHVWWRLKSLGRSNVAVLEGGAAAWRLHPGTAALTFPHITSESQFDCVKVDHFWKTEEEVEEQRLVPGWEYQLISTEKSSSTAVHFEPNLVFTSIGRFEEPGFLKEIVLTAGVDLSENCQSIVSGRNACTLLLGLSLLGKRNLCLCASKQSDDQPASPRLNFSIGENDEFFTAVEEEEFFDAVSDSRRVSISPVKGAVASTHSTSVMSAPKTDLKRMIPNSVNSNSPIDMKTTKSCNCAMM